MRFDSELCAAERTFLEERDEVVLRGIRAFIQPRASGTLPTPQSPGATQTIVENMQFFSFQ